MAKGRRRACSQASGPGGRGAGWLGGASRWVGSVGDADQRQRAVVKQLVGQRALGRPDVGLRVVALEAVRVLDDVVGIEDASAGDVELVVDHRRAVVHPTLLQVLTLDEFVGLGVVGDHSPGVPWEERKHKMMSKKCSQSWFRSIR